jgi:single-strand DNA-binding protein
MNNLNSVLIEGDLMRDPELSYTREGAAVCTFTVASQRCYKQDEKFEKEVSCFDVTTQSRLAEICGEYLKKGRGVRIVGRLKQVLGPQGEDGLHVPAKVIIVAEHVEFKPDFKKRPEATSAISD